MTDLPPASLPPRTSFFSRLRTYFFTGLVIAAPAAITIWATLWFISIFDHWFKPLLPPEFNPDTYLPFKIPGFGLLFALIAITALGALAANLVGSTLIGLWDKLMNRTPVVRSIYRGSKQLFETMFSGKGTSFRHVCLVQWPRHGIFTPAFISREVDGCEIGLERGRKLYAVYVSTTPNPTGGYVFFADQSDVRILDMSVEDGLKMVISMGLVLPDCPLPHDEEVQAALAAPLRRAGAAVQPAPRKRKPSSRSKR